MTKIMTSLLAGTAVLGLTAVVHAADMGGPYRAPQVIQSASEPVFGGGWYLRGDIGVGFTERGAWAETNIDKPGAFAPAGWYERRIDNVGTISAGVGYQFTEYLRGDITAQYRTQANVNGVNYITQLKQADTVDGVKGHIDTAVVMANGYVDIGRYSGLTPYLGAGIGVAYHHVGEMKDSGIGPQNPGASGAYGSSSNGSLAWALHAGFAYDIAPNLKMDLGYTYLNLGEARSGELVCSTPCNGGRLNFKEFASNDVHIGLRYLFADPAPVRTPLPTPIVAKY
jgi:opacity protein-like surface antigen